MKNDKNNVLMPVVGIFVVAALGGLIWKTSNSSSPSLTENEVISRRGIHWHSELKIFINGQDQEIPAGVGLGVTHQPIHTHETDRIIHMEFDGLVLKKDTRVGQFFDIWEKKFSKDCIFEFCNGDNGNVKMTVNGQSNNDFENYLMKDGDKIEIRFE